MRQQGLKALISTIFSDEKTRQQFESDPESIMSKYSLSKQEKRAVLSTQAKLGLAADGQQVDAEIGPFSTWV